MKPPSSTLKFLSHRDELGAWLNATGLTGHGVEVGTLYGAYAQKLLSTWSGHVSCVDPWANQDEAVYHDGQNKLDMTKVWAHAQAALGQHQRCSLLRMMSLEGAKRFEDGSLDFVYLDGNHAPASVRDDINTWFPKVKIGGIFSGHDFFTRYDKDTNSDAQAAVMEFAEHVGQWPHVTWCTSWFFVKTREMAEKFHSTGYAAPRADRVNNADVRVIPVLAVSHVDFHLAVKWLKWAMLLRPQTVTPPHPLVVFGSKALEPARWDELKACASGLPTVVFRATPEVYEKGYAPSANYQFRTALEMVEREYPGAAMLWCEADTVPMRPSWVAEIQAEYQKCGRPFMGDVVRHPRGTIGIDHLTGVAVYSPHWRHYAPSLAMLPEPRPQQGWDSLCSHETLPQAHQATTIQQIWRYGTKDSQPGKIRPEAALFHQDKAGKLIDRLAHEMGVERIPLGKALMRPTVVSAPVVPQDGVVTGACAILIVACKRDMDFLRYCLRSIAQFAHGFSEVVLVVPLAEAHAFRWAHDKARVLAFDEPPGKGMLAHEIRICRADELCPTADFVLHMDADCLFWKDVRPADYLPGGKCLTVREAYEKITNPNRHIWRDVVERATGIRPDFDPMVRHPQVFPRGLYRKVRDRVEQHTGRGFDEYVYSCENGFPQGYAEFPTIHAVGQREMPERFHAVEYDHAADAAICGKAPGEFQYLYMPARDFMVEGWSHGGIGRYKLAWDAFLRGELPQYFVK